MKKLFVLTLGVCLRGLVSANAEDKKEGKGEKHEIPAKVLEKYDKNKDGKLDDSEKEAMKQDRKEALKKFDKNGDGKLDDSEKAAAKEAAKEGGEKHHKKKDKADSK